MVGQRGQAQIGRYPVEPGANGGSALERLPGSPCPQVRLLDQVLGLVHRADHAVAMRDQLVPVGLRVVDEFVPALVGSRRGAHMFSDKARCRTPFARPRYRPRPLIAAHSERGPSLSGPGTA